MEGCYLEDGDGQESSAEGEECEDTKEYEGTPGRSSGAETET